MKMNPKVLLLTIVMLFQCYHKDCYEVRLIFKQTSNGGIGEASPVFINGAIIGYLEQYLAGNDVSKAIICIPNAVKIQKDSKFLGGFIKRYGTSGIEITPGTQNKFLDQGDLVDVSCKDSIDLKMHEIDSVLVKKLIEITNQLNDKDKRKK